MSSAAKGGERTGLLRKAWDAAVDLMLRKEMVGTDKHGNRYYRYFENNRGARVERREVKWNTIYVMYDPNDVPSEWRMWLRKLRADPPTDVEMQQSEAKARAMQARVAALEEQERLRRLRMQSMGMHSQQASHQPDIGRFIQQMGPEEAAAAAAAASAASKGGAGSSPAGGAAPAGGSGSSTAGSQSQTPEPKGSGDTFTPGVWRPGQ